MKAFKAYDIRGEYGVDFDKESVYKMGFFLPQLLHVDKILVGRDIRLSSDEIFETLTQGIIDAGCDVYNIGLATTPMVYYATAKHGFEASVQITASHNPKNHNGLKISGKNAMPIGYDTGLKDLEYKVEHDKVAAKAVKGKIIELQLLDEYIQFQLSYRPAFDNLNMVVDCSNGMANLLVDKIFGSRPYYINKTMDGSFPGHEPNPLEPKNIVQLQQTVKQQHADIGVIFDGDADRVMFVDEKGDFISPDLMIALLGHYFLEERKEYGNVLFDIRTSKSVKEYLQNMGATINIWRVGRAYAALKLREIDGVFGGELAGHYYFRDFFYSDSGMLASILILNILAKFKSEGKTVSQVVAGIVNYANSGEINYVVDNKSETMEKIKNYFCEKETYTEYFDFDGYRIEFKDWWFNIRPSNTEPYLRFIAEARTQTLLQEKLQIVRQLIGQ